MNTNTQACITLMIVDDQALFSSGLKALLAPFDDIKVVACVNTLDKALKTYPTQQPDIVMCDLMLEMGKKHIPAGLTLLEEILRLNTQAGVIFYSQFDDEDLIQQSYNTGVKAFLTKDIDIDEMVAAIREVHSGDIYLSDSVARQLANITIGKNDRSKRSPKNLLDKRQLDIFVLVAQGYTQTEIAQKLALHQRTITSEMAKLKEALGVERQAELTILAIEYNLIDTTNYVFSGKSA